MKKPERYSYPAIFTSSNLLLEQCNNLQIAVNI